MRILVADTFPAAHLAELTEHGHDCAYRPDTSTEELAGRISGQEVLIVRSTRVPAAVLENAGSLRLVIRAGSGTNTIDRETASERGIAVCNVPGRNAVAVAELAFGLLLAIDRSIYDNIVDLRAGRWDKKRYSRAQGISGRRIGVVGLGQTGLAFAERAAAFGATVYAVAKTGRSPETLTRALASGVRFVDNLATLAQTCDVLSLHVPATAGTRHLVDAGLLARMKPGTIILNTSRGDLIDEDALIEAMEDKNIRAGLDVYADEPATGTGNIESRLARHPNVYGTHHIGASTEQAQRAIADEVVRMIDAFEAGTTLHCVNAEELHAVQGATRSGDMP